jgi:hypothetical protein
MLPTQWAQPKLNSSPDPSIGRGPTLRGDLQVPRTNQGLALTNLAHDLKSSSGDNARMEFRLCALHRGPLHRMGRPRPIQQVKKKRGHFPDMTDHGARLMAAPLKCV